jgi:hypothetical protein
VVIDLDTATVGSNGDCQRLVPGVNELARAVRNAGRVVAWVMSHMPAMPRHFEAVLGVELAGRYFSDGQCCGAGTTLWHGLERAADDLQAVKPGASAFFPGKINLKEQSIPSESTRPYRAMQFLTSGQCQRWVSQRDWPSLLDIRELEQAGWQSIRFRIPADAGQRVALARALWQHLPSRFPRLVWVTEWGVWNSAEHMPLYSALRYGLGDSGGLANAPGHAVDSHEADHGLSVVILAILFLWDAWVLTDAGAALFLSHDEWGLALSRDREWLASAQRQLLS